AKHADHSAKRVRRAGLLWRPMSAAGSGRCASLLSPSAVRESPRVRLRRRVAAPPNTVGAPSLCPHRLRGVGLPRHLRESSWLRGDRLAPTFAITITDAPVSATTAIHSVATPATATSRNAAFITRGEGVVVETEAGSAT